MFKSFLRFGTVLANSAVATTISKVNELKSILNGSSNLDDEIVFKNEVDPDIDRELGNLAPYSTTPEIDKSKSNELLTLTRSMTIEIVKMIPGGFTETVHGIDVTFDLVQAKLVKPANLVEHIFFIGKDIPKESQWARVGITFQCRLQHKYSSGELYNYLATLVASGDQADDYVLPLDDVENIARPGSSDDRYI
jgi:hypothetical protein